MDIEYDDDADAAYVWLVARPADMSQVVDAELWPEELQNKIGLLFDDEKRLVGLEFLSASRYLPRGVLDGLDS
jgi:uncharacterized protein YuzE